MKYELKATKTGERIDKYLAENLEYSRSEIKKMIDMDQVCVNGKTIKSSYKIAEGDCIVFNYIEDKIKLIPKKIDLDIIYEDQDIILINKPKDMIVHPANQDQQDTLVNGLIYRYENLGNMDSERPGIVHRLDKDTTGLLVIARTDQAYENLVGQFSEGSVKRKYLTLVHGIIDNKLIVDKPIGRNQRDRTKMDIDYKNGKPAISVVNPLEYFDDYSLLEVELKTGRTHQIRVHLMSLGHPVVGDLVYGYPNKFGIDTQLLHSYFLEFKHPRTGKEISFKTQIPKYFEEFIGRL